MVFLHLDLNVECNVSVCSVDKANSYLSSCGIKCLDYICLITGFGEAILKFVFSVSPLNKLNLAKIISLERNAGNSRCYAFPCNSTLTKDIFYSLHLGSVFSNNSPSILEKIAIFSQYNKIYLATRHVFNFEKNDLEKNDLAAGFYKRALTLEINDKIRRGLIPRFGVLGTLFLSTPSFSYEQVYQDISTHLYKPYEYPSCRHRTLMLMPRDRYVCHRTYAG